MRVIGYGICGPGESKRYMKATLDEFKRLCDDTVILVNGTYTETVEERKLIEKYGFKWATDPREWGKNQWRIKEDFVRTHVQKLNPDWCVCLDMDEVFEPHFTRNALELLTTKGNSFVFFICNLWDEGWNKALSFWNVRMWKWSEDLAWERKPLHCGLAPLWARQYVNHAPYLLLHYGLKEKSDRLKKYERYQIYDPSRAYLKGNYYDSLRSAVGEPFDIEKVHQIIADEVASYKEQRKEVRGLMTGQKFVFVRRLKDGVVLDIPESMLAQTLKQGFELIGDAKPPQPPQPIPVEPAPLKCIICGYQAMTEKGLAMHNRRKHP